MFFKSTAGPGVLGCYREQMEDKGRFVGPNSQGKVVGFVLEPVLSKTPERFLEWVFCL